MKTRNAPWYDLNPVSSIPALARALGVPEEELRYVHSLAPTSYKRQERSKPDGGIRVTYSLRRNLSNVQKRILDRLLRRVHMPDYLLGGRPKRSYLDNVSYHCGAKILFGEDVTSFFPSIRRSHVKGIFQHLMHFPPEVAEFLADLCTYEGAVPQGGRTSGELANLVLWRSEPAMVNRFHARGLKYSRFVDDVYVSSSVSLRSADKTWIVNELHTLLLLEGFRAKRKKHELTSSGSKMAVHRVGINSGRPSIPRSLRSNLRAGVRNLEKSAATAEDPNIVRELAKLRGQVARLKQFHPAEYAKLNMRLKLVAAQIKKTN
jgi:hypothetical protein